MTEETKDGKTRSSQLSAVFQITRHMDQNAQVDLVAHGKIAKMRDMVDMILFMVDDGREYVIKFGDWYTVDDSIRDFTEYARHGLVMVHKVAEAQVGELVPYAEIERYHGTNEPVVHLYRSHLFDLGDSPDPSKGPPPPMVFKIVTMGLDPESGPIRVAQRVQ